jgi:ABC-type nitrate/sulfonate/bicarbonate transport system substrate-binding protein
MKFAYGLILSLLAIATATAQQRPTYESLVGNVPVNEVSQSPEVQVPFIFWGGDVATFVANGGLTTTPNSEFGRQGLRIRLVPGDDAKQQVRDYKTGKSPFLRMTDMMAYMASEVVSRDPRTKPVMFLQLTWSLGDHIVFKEPDANLRQTPQGVEVLRPTQLQDWKGRPKKVRLALQAEGPHIGLTDDSLKSAGMTWDDIEPVWCKDLTATDDSPAERLRKGQADAACVITPDMIGLTSGLDAVGSGAEKTTKGARVINSTSVMDKSIGDFYLCRTDWYNSHQDWVKKFNVGWLKTAEAMMKWKDAYANGKGRSPEYVAALKDGSDDLRQRQGR